MLTTGAKLENANNSRIKSAKRIIYKRAFVPLGLTSWRQFARRWFQTLQKWSMWRQSEQDYSLGYANMWDSASISMNSAVQQMIVQTELENSGPGCLEELGSAHVQELCFSYSTSPEAWTSNWCQWIVLEWRKNCLKMKRKPVRDGSGIRQCNCKNWKKRFPLANPCKKIKVQRSVGLQNSSTTPRMLHWFSRINRLHK